MGGSPSEPPGRSPAPERAVPARAVPAPDVARRIRGGGEAPVLLDLRDAAEYREGHVTGAIHMTLDRLARWKPHLAGGREVYCYGSGSDEHRAEQAAATLSRRGLPAAFVSGGWQELRRAGVPVVAEGWR